MTGRFRQAIKKLLHTDLPLPDVLRPGVRRLYQAGVLLSEGLALVYKWLVVSPVMRAICNSVGPGLRIERIPYIRGHGTIELGAKVYISGKIGIGLSTRSPGVTPALRIGSHSFIGHQCSFNLRHGITLGEHCLLAGGIIIQDHDGHPLDPHRRQAGEPAPESEVHAVTIGNNVWIGRRSLILKGVQVGDNAVIGAGSLVVRDVPANTVVAGNPARVIRELGTDEGDLSLSGESFKDEPGQTRHG